MATCPSTYFTATLSDLSVPSSVSPYLLLAGSVRDLTISVQAFPPAVLDHYDKIHWSFSIPDTATWAHVAGMWYNLYGQTSLDRIIDLTTPAPWKDHWNITLNGIFPPSNNNYLAPGPYDTIITVNYTAVNSSNGATCTGSVSIPIHIYVLEAQRYVPATHTVSQNNMTEVGTFPDNINYPACQSDNRSHASFGYRADAGTTGSYDVNLTVNYLRPSSSNDTPTLGVPQSSLVRFEAQTLPVGMPSHDLNISWPKKGAGWANNDSWGDYKVSYLTSTGAMDNVGNSLDYTKLNMLFGGTGIDSLNDVAIYQSDVWVSTSPDQFTDDKLKTDIETYPCTTATPLGIEPPPPSPCVVAVNPVPPLLFNAVQGGPPVTVGAVWDFTISGLTEIPVWTPAVPAVPVTLVSGPTPRANPLVYDVSFTFNPAGSTPGTLNRVIGSINWRGDQHQPCSSDLSAYLTVTSPPVSPPPVSPPPVSPPPVSPPPVSPPVSPPPSGSPPPPLYATDGTLFPLVPFELDLFPMELRVQADRHSGLFSGDFEVGVLIKPGPTQHRSAEVTDLVRLHVTGSPQVQFFSQLPYKSSPGPFQVAITPTNWDLKTGYIYDLTCEVYVTNNTYLNQQVSLLVSVTDLDQVDQVIAITERSSLYVRSNTTEVVLLALMVSASVTSRSDIKVVVFAGETEIESHVMVNCDTNAEIPLYYQVTTPSTLSMTRGTPFSLQFTTAGGEEGTVIWTVNDPMFLSSHGMRFTQSGVLKSDGNVLGPAVQQSLIFMARKETGLLTRVYASKIIDLIIM